MGNQLSADYDGNIVITPAGVVEAEPRHPVVSTLSTTDSYWNPEEGQPGWRIPVQMPPDTPRESNSTAPTIKGLKCSDIKRVPNDSRRRICSSTFGYVPNVDVTSFKGIQPNNVPIGFTNIGTTPVAFITGQSACPRQCGDLSKTTVVTDALVKWDPRAESENKYALLTRDANNNQQWSGFSTMRDLQSSEEYAKLMRDSPNNFTSELWAMLRQLQKERRIFAGKNQEEIKRSNREMWGSASDLPMDEIPVATEVAKIAEQTLQQQVTCVKQGGDIPDNWASMERYPAQVLNPEEKAGFIPTTCQVETKATSPLGDTSVTTAIVPSQDVESELSAQAKSMVDGFAPTARPQQSSQLSNSVQQADMDMLMNAFAPSPPLDSVLVNALAPEV